MRFASSASRLPVSTRSWCPHVASSCTYVPDSRRPLLSILVTPCTQHTKCMCLEGILLVRSSEFVCTKTTISILMKSGIVSYTVKLFILDFDSYRFTMRSRCSVVGVATTLQAGRSGARIPVRARDFSLPLNVQTVFGAHPVSCRMGIRVFPPRVKRPGREVKHSPRNSVEVRNEWGSVSPT